jgi:hypothetical protein
LAFLIRLVVTFTLAASFGLAATFVALERGVSFGDITVGDWRFQPQRGSSDIDPYQRAVIARSGELPLVLGDGIAFVARHDGSGQRLDGGCPVVIRGVVPAARFWTVSLYDAAGRLIDNPSQRRGFTSNEVVRSADGSFTITVGPQPVAGNWLPSGGAGARVLMLRLYDSPVSTATLIGGSLGFPTITRTGECR